MCPGPVISALQDALYYHDCMGVELHSGCTQKHVKVSRPLSCMLLMMLAYTSSSVETEGLGTRLLILMIKTSLTLWRHYKVNNGAWFCLKHSLHSLLSSILKDWLRPYLLFSIYIACALPQLYSIGTACTPHSDTITCTSTVVRIMTIFTGLSNEHARMRDKHVDDVSLHTYIHTYIHRYSELAIC